MQVIELNAFGLDQLSLVDREKPEAGRGEVLLRFEAASVNPRDYQIITGHFAPKVAFPLIPLSDGAGIVEAVGDGVSRVSIGDRVTPTFFPEWISGEALHAERAVSSGLEAPGTLREYGVYPESAVVRAAPHLSAPEAACLPCAGLTAWTALVTMSQIGRGDTVLLQGTGGVALAGLSVIAQTTVDYLNPSSDEVSATSIGDILAETTRRTSKGSGSTFVPPAVSSPTDWPYASLRTLTRPLVIEAHGFSQLLVAAEMMALLGLSVVSWRRVVNLPRLMMTNPFVAFAMTTLFLAGLAYSSFANLGVLTRQKSLIFPFMLLIPCLPERVAVTRRLPREEEVLVSFSMIIFSLSSRAVILVTAARLCPVISDISTREAVCTTLFVRGLKRIQAHLANIASSIVLPVHEIDHRPKHLRD